MKPGDETGFQTQLWGSRKPIFGGQGTDKSFEKKCPSEIYISLDIQIPIE